MTNMVFNFFFTRFCNNTLPIEMFSVVFVHFSHAFVIMVGQVNILRHQGQTGQTRGKQNKQMRGRKENSTKQDLYLLKNSKLSHFKRKSKNLIIGEGVGFIRILSCVLLVTLSIVVSLAPRNVIQLFAN